MPRSLATEETYCRGIQCAKDSASQVCSICTEQESRVVRW